MASWRALAMAMMVPCGAMAAPLDEVPPPGFPACPSGEDAPDVVALLRRTEQVLEGRSSIATLSMEIVTPKWKRKLKLKVWSKGRDFALVRVLEGGPREVGLMTLRREEQLWNYLPQAGRVMKLPSGMMGDSWLGSDFTNDDLVNGSSIADDFEARIAGTLQHEGGPAWRVVLTPKASAAVVWGRVEMVIDRQSCVPRLQRFYDEEGALARSLAFGEVRKIGWRRLPMLLTVTPADAGRSTSLRYEELAFDVDVPSDTFSLNRLQRGR